MKIIRIVSLLSLLCAFFSCHAQDRGFESVSSDAFENLITDTSVVRLDVRTAEEFEAGHIENAINIDVLKDDFEANALSILPVGVSVSAMQPCSASFNSLPLPREYNITNMTAAKRYESVWNAFLNELPHNPTTTLTSFLKRCNVRQGRMKRWMENNGLSVKEAKKRLRDCQHDGIGDPMSPLSEDSGSLFLPMATDKPAPRSESCDILSGVSLTFPDGTQVNIKRGSAQAVMSFLKLYQREDLPCLD